MKLTQQMGGCICQWLAFLRQQNLLLKICQIRHEGQWLAHGEMNLVSCTVGIRDQRRGDGYHWDPTSWVRS